MIEPMFTLRGQVVHVFVSPIGINKDTGEEYGGQDKVQILGDVPIKGGETRKDMLTLTTEQGTQLKAAVGQSVIAPVAFYVNKGAVAFYIPKGSEIDIQGVKTIQQ